jgi:hypothetical protein
LTNKAGCLIGSGFSDSGKPDLLFSAWQFANKLVESDDAGRKNEQIADHADDYDQCADCPKIFERFEIAENEDQIAQAKKDAGVYYRPGELMHRR